MIGQEVNKQCLMSFLDSDKCPRLTILVGAKGSGRKTLASLFAHMLHAYEVLPGNSVESVRETIASAYKCDHNTLYIFPDADKMSIAAKNALLKITEEPPRSAYFVLTVESRSNMLPTLLSRATTLNMEPYSGEELLEYILKATPGGYTPERTSEVLSMAENPGQVIELFDMDTTAFIAFCSKVLDNIGVVTGVNAFKIGQSFSFKEDTPGYNPILFFNCICKIAYERAFLCSDVDKVRRLRNTLKCCSFFKQQFSLTGVKKDATFDMWVLEMRKIWTEVGLD